MNKIRLAAVSIATCIAAAYLAAVPASADGSQSIDQPFVTPIGTTAPAAQDHVAALESLDDPVADLVSLVADTIFSLGQNLGFAGQTVDATAHSIDLYWKGDLPDAVTTYLSTASLLGVNVTVITNAAFSRIEEQAASQAVGSSDLVGQAGITSISANHTGTGITVQMAGAEPSDDVKAQIAQVAGLDSSAVTYEPNVGDLVEQTASRNNDTVPWKGGGRIILGGIHGCSSGFAVLSGSLGRLLSDAHCRTSTTQAVTDGAGNAIAPASGVSTIESIDSMSIDPTASPATTAKIFTGAWNSTTLATVKNWSSNWVGDAVCGGGATTGTHCGTVVDDAVTYPGHTGAFYIRVRATSGAFSGGADSGGPVYKNVTGGVQARGLILAGYTGTAVTCGAHNPDVDPAPCTHESLYLPISVALNTWGYSLEVG